MKGSTNPRAVLAGSKPDFHRRAVLWRWVPSERGAGNVADLRRCCGPAPQDAAVLAAWMDRHREDTKQRSEHRGYQLIYINGPVTLPQPAAEIRTVLPVEQTFKDRMFAGAHGGAA